MTQSSPISDLSEFLDIPPTRENSSAHQMVYPDAPLTGKVVGIIDPTAGLIEVALDGADPETDGTIVAPGMGGEYAPGAQVRVLRDTSGRATMITAPLDAPKDVPTQPIGRAAELIAEHQAYKEKQRLEWVPWVESQLDAQTGSIANAIADVKREIAEATKGDVLAGKVEKFLKVTTAMLVAGEARIGGNLLAETITLSTSIVAGNPDGTHAKMDPTGLRVYRKQADGSISEVVRLGTDASNDYLGIVDAAGTLVSSMDDVGGGNFQNVTVSGALSAEGIMLGGLDVGAELSRPRAKLASYTESNLTEPTYNAVIHGGDAIVWMDEQAVTNSSSEPVACLYVASPLNIMVTAHANGSRTPGNINAFLRYEDREAGVIQQPGVSSPLLAHGVITNQAPGFTFPGFSTLFIVPPNTTRTTTLFIQATGSRFQVPKAPYKAGIVLLGPTTSASELPGRMIGYSNDLQYGGYTPPPPQTRVTRTETFNPTWAATYSNGNRYTAYDGDGVVVHGQVPGLSYHGVGLIGFPDIVSRLSGATVDMVEAYVYFRHWYQNSGGRFGLGVHNALHTPGNLNGGVAITHGTTTKPGGTWITLPSTVNQHFKSGAYRGLLLKAGSNNLAEYGLADWRQTRLRITYTK